MDAMLCLSVFSLVFRRYFSSLVFRRRYSFLSVIEHWLWCSHVGREMELGLLFYDSMPARWKTARKCVSLLKHPHFNRAPDDCNTPDSTYADSAEFSLDAGISPLWTLLGRMEDVLAGFFLVWCVRAS